MRTIHKGQEPESLTFHRKQHFADYDNFSDKDTLRRSLVEEQRGLCCYCQSRIYPNIDGMKIEHWQSQKNYPHRQLDYANLLAACKGGDGVLGEPKRCDTLKADSELRFNPADQLHNIEQQISFLNDGRIKSSDIVFDNQLNKVLNLNWSRFVSNRKAALDAFKEQLKPGKPLDAHKLLSNWDGSSDGNLEPYAQVIVYWLRKKQARVTK